MLTVTVERIDTGARVIVKLGEKVVSVKDITGKQAELLLAARGL